IDLASESIVLLKNQDVLPLRKGSRIMVTGPAAHSKAWLNGGWTFEWLGAEEKNQPADMPTFYEALCSEFGRQNVSHVKESELPANSKMLKQKVASYDAIILALGEPPYSEFKGNITNLTLPEDQIQLIKRLSLTKKPCIAVLIEGRPRVISPHDSLLQAILFAGLPGSGGGTALAGIISGKIVPSGKLSFSYPSSAGHIVPYNRKPSESYLPAWPFGHGLTYTKFAYDNLTIADTIVQPNDTLHFSVNLSNKGDLPGIETVLWFVRQETGRVITRPVKKLLAFQRVFLKPGETKTITTYIIPSQQLAYPMEDGTLLLDKGEFFIETGGIFRNFFVR
ncbi:MAG: glycoside hydrolase family 3 C-terminal domain-containing protein, partial [Bacteroidales bacterium]